MACAEIYVALKCSGVDFLWISKDGKGKSFYPDRACEIYGKRIYFEVETGTQYDKPEVVLEKLHRYFQLTGWFHVVFVTMDYDHRITEKTYGAKILKLIAEFSEGKKRNGEPLKLGTRFLVSFHSLLSINPHGQYLALPTGQRFSFESLPIPYSREENLLEI